MSRCIREREIFALLDGSLKPAAKARVEAHLASCSECASRVATIHKLKSAAVEALPPLEPNWSRINPAIEHAISEISSCQRPKIAWAPLGLSIAAAALVAIALFVSSAVDKPDFATPEPLELAEAEPPEVVYQPLELIELSVIDTSSADRSLPIGRRIVAGDAVATGPVLAARVAVGPSATLDLYPESRIQLHSDTVLRPTVELAAGTSRFDIPAGALEHELTVLAGDTVFTVLDGTFELSITKDGLIVAVHQGEVTVAGSEEPKALAAGVWRTGDRPVERDDWLRLDREQVEVADGGVGGDDLTEREWQRPTGTLPRRVV